jgi:hypothetical protein
MLGEGHVGGMSALLEFLNRESCKAPSQGAQATETPMSDMIPFVNGGQMASRPARRAARSINISALSAQVRVAQSNAESDVVDAKMENDTMVTGKAMVCVVKVAKLQSDLELIAPEASGRLSMLADGHVFGLSDLMADGRRMQRRI